MRIVHAADLHLDSPLRGLDRYPGAPVDRIRDASRRALENLVGACLAESVDLVLLAGDLFDGDWRDFRTGLFFASQMNRLRAADIPVVLVRGNHDAASRVSRQLVWPDNVVELPTEAPGSCVLERLGVAVHGQGFARPDVSEDLAARFPAPAAGLFNIGLLHTSADGRPGHAPYAPTRVATLVDRGYDYWALGHVHQREVLCEDPPILFPGNLQGRHVREVGPKGATFVAVERGRVARLEPRSFDVVRWDRCTVDATEAATAEEVVARCRDALAGAVDRAEERLLAARLVLTGTTPVDGALRAEPGRWAEEIHEAARELGDEVVWVERVVLDTRPHLDLDEVARRQDAAGQVAAAFRRYADDADALGELASTLAELRAKLPRELQEGEDALALDDPDTLRALLADAERGLLPRLVGGAGR